MEVFISRLCLIDSRRNSRFPAEIASLVIEGLLHGIVGKMLKITGHISDFEHFFLHLKFTPKPNFLDCIR